MNIIEEEQNFKCPTHKNFIVQFVKVDNLEKNEKYQQLFYCPECVFSDQAFKSESYQLFQNIINLGNKEILQKWPPGNNKQQINKLIEISKGNKDQELIQAEIETYFVDLKNKVVKQIDIYKKCILRQMQEFYQNQTQIINRYEEISKVKDLKNIFMDKKTNINEKEKQYRTFFENMYSEKNSIKEQLLQILDSFQKQTNIFDSEIAHKRKKEILKSIKSIKCFGKPNILIENIDDDDDGVDDNKKQLQVQLLATDLNQGENCQQITKNQNNQYQIVLNKIVCGWQNTVSNLILDNETKYIFRLKIELYIQDDICFIGLILDRNVHIAEGFLDYLCVRLQKNNKYICQPSNNAQGISKQLKGTFFQLSEENEIEIRVCLKDQLLEVLDYPHYKYKIGVEDYKKRILNERLRLYIGLHTLNNKVILKEAFTVNTF